METAMIQTTEFERTQTIDPRQAKLTDIIEKGKASLHKTLEEIQHEFSIREDMAVRPTAIRGRRDLSRSEMTLRMSLWNGSGMFLP